VPNKQPSDEVEHNSDPDGLAAKVIDAPFSPNQPNTANANTTRGSEVKTDVKILQNRLKSAEKWMIVFTGIIAFLALFQVVAGLLQWGAMKDQLAEMRTGSGDTRILADAAKRQADKAEAISGNVQRSADQMERIAENTEKALKTSVVASRLEERAWVEIAPMKATKILGTPFNAFRYALVPKNVGKSAARGIVVHVAPQLTVSAQDTERASAIHVWQDMYLTGRIKIKIRGKLEALPNSQRAEQKVLGPGEAFSIPIQISGSEPSVDSKMVSELIGRVDYRDEFNVRHWMRFCYYVADPEGGLEICKAGNDEDHNPETFDPGPNQE
jgi:hypothetical protein